MINALQPYPAYRDSGVAWLGQVPAHWEVRRLGFDSNRHHRRSIRLKRYNYTQPGAYFVTICTDNRECLFGKIVDGEMILNDAGRVAEACWQAIPDHFPHVALDAHVIMPNHVHGVIVIGDDNPRAKDVDAAVGVGAKNFSPLRPPLQPPTRPRGTSKTIGSIVRGFKIGVTKWFRANTHIYAVWQRNYYEHIIRDENELNHIRQYIINNPLKWALDRENPDAVGVDTGTDPFFASGAES